jgi:hypothetical protein
MPKIEYRVVPFIGAINSRGSAKDASQQLQKVIAEHAVDGWEFHSLGNINIEVKPGCLASFLGASSDYIRFDQVVFQKRS